VGPPLRMQRMKSEEFKCKICDETSNHAKTIEAMFVHFMFPNGKIYYELDRDKFYELIKKYGKEVCISCLRKIDDEYRKKKIEYVVNKKIKEFANES
jgi:hypothetical protein